MLELEGIGSEGEKGDNVKQRMVELFGRVSPGIADILHDSVDVVHRLGPKGGQVNPR